MRYQIRKYVLQNNFKILNKLQDNFFNMFTKFYNL